MKIRNKLILGFVGVALLVAIVGLLSISVSQNVLQKEIEGQCVNIAYEYLGQINRHIYLRIEALQEYCKNRIIEHEVLKSNGEFDKLDDIQALIQKRESQWISAPAEHITIAEDGNQAIQKVLTQQFDLIFMDIMMPHMNGYDATRELRKQGVKTPIVALTANAMKGDDKKCLEAGCNEYLAKPIDRRELLKTVSKYLPAKEPALIGNTDSQ